MAGRTRTLFYRDVESNYSNSSRFSQRRKIEHSNLPPYDPETEITDIINSFGKEKKTNFLSLFRYATIFDKILITVGILFSMLTSVFIPWSIYTIGRLLHGIVADAKCQNLTDNRRTKLELELMDAFFWNVVITFVVESASRYIANKCLSLAADNQIEYIRIKFFTNLVMRDISWFDYFVNRSYVREMSDSITKMRIGMGETLGRCIHDISAVLLLIALCVYHNVLLAVCLIVVLPIGLFSSTMGAAADRKYVQTSQKAYASAQVFAEEVLANIKIVKIFGAESTLLDEYYYFLGKPSWKETGWLILSAFFLAIIYLGNNIAYWCIFWWVPSEIDFEKFCNTSKPYLEHHHNVLEINPSFDHDSPAYPIMVFFAIFDIATRIADIPKYMCDLMEAQDQVAEIFFAMSIKQRINNPAVARVTPRSAAIGRIEFSDVGFRYVREPQTWAVRNVTMTMYPGQIIAIVGATGSGKSTILKLINRLYDPCEGQILLDGNHIEAMDVNWLRRQVCYVMQDPILFNTTVEQNIKCVHKTAKMQDILDACKTVEIHSDIMELPHGYSTVVGHKGDIFTENQKRLICLARAFLHRPRIVLLDDPQPTPDTAFDAVLNSIVSKLREQATVIVTSTKCSTLVTSADLVFVMKKGRMAESGTHKELLSRKSLYQSLLRKTLDADVGDTRKRFPSQLAAYRYSHNLEQIQEEKSKAEYDLGIEMNKTVLKKVTRGVGGQPTRFGKAALVGYGFVGTHRRQSNYILSHKDKQDIMKKTPVASFSSVDGRHSRKKKQNENKDEPMKSLKVMNEAVSKSPRFSSRAFFRENPDIASICSEDSFIFWDDYLERLESWLRNTSAAKWADFFSLAFKRKVLPFSLLGIGISMVLGMYLPYQAFLLGEMFLATSERSKIIRARYLNESYQFLDISAGCALAAFIQIIAFGTAGNRLCTLLRFNVFGKLLATDLQWYDKPENDIRVLSEILTYDTKNVQKNVLLHCGIMFQILSWLIFSIAWAIFLNPILYSSTLCLAAASPILFFVSYIERKRLLSHDDILNWNLQSTNELAFEVINNIKVAASLNLEEYFIEEYSMRLKKHSWLFYLYNIWGVLVMSIAPCLPLLSLGIFVRFSYPEHLTTEAGFRYFADVQRIGWLLIMGTVTVAQQLALLPSTKNTRTALNKINSILSTESAIEDANPEACRIYLKPPHVALKDVAFQYPVMKEKPVLHGITFEFLPETFVAIVGPSGSGKTTIANIMARLYDPSSGAVYFDNENVTHMSRSSIRKLVSTVETSDIGLMNMTIEETIAFGENYAHISYRDIIAAAKLTRVHDYVTELPKGYQTKILALPHDAATYALKQRIAIARAIIGDPKILILDGFTSAVDYRSAKLMEEAINDARIGRTLIVLSEAIEPIRNADFVVVLNNGYIEEVGEDSYLMQKKGLFYNMLMTQRLESADLTSPQVENPGKLVVSNRRRNSAAYNRYVDTATAHNPALRASHPHIVFELQSHSRKSATADSPSLIMQIKKDKDEDE